MAKIIIIDDESQILSMLEAFLKRDGSYMVETFSNPVSGLNYVLSNSVDLVLLDIMMPQMDGISFLKKIKTTNPNIIVIMMTAHTTLERTIEAHRYGAKNYLTKPFKSLKEVKEKIDKELA